MLCGAPLRGAFFFVFLFSCFLLFFILCLGLVFFCVFFVFFCVFLFFCFFLCLFVFFSMSYLTPKPSTPKFISPNYLLEIMYDCSLYKHSAFFMNQLHSIHYFES